MDRVKSSRGYVANESKPILVTEEIGLMDFLIKQFPFKNRDNIKSLLSKKQVFVDGRITTRFNHILIPGQTIAINPSRVPDRKELPGYSIVYEDAALIVIDKQAGLLSISTETEKQATAFSMLSSYVKKKERTNKIFIVHRLDRETSGLMLFARNESVKHRLQDTWSDSVIDRSYIALVEGIVEKAKGSITSYLFEDKNFKMHSSPFPGKGVKSITHFETLKKNEYHSLLKISLETGRKNQIRIHMQDMGHPVAGDKKYGALTNPLKRLGLHAQSLSFLHPVSNKTLTFETPIPKSFLKLF